MAHQWVDRVAETTTTTGTGALTLAGAITGYQRFSAVFSVNDTVIYAIEAVDANSIPTGDWEVGVGTYSGTNTLTRTTVIKSSNSNAAVSFAAGTKNVFLDDIAETRNQLQQYSGTSEPSAPVEGLIVYAQDRNGWPVPYAKGAAYRSMALDPSMSGRPSYGYALAVGGATVFTSIGVTLSSNGTPTTATAGTSSVFARFNRINAATSSTASTVCSFRDSNSSIFARGTGADDGFRCRFVFGLDTVGNTNCRYFVGLLSTGSAQAAAFDPNTSAQIEVGIGCTGTDTTNMKLYFNDAVGAPSATDLGANYPAKTGRAAVVELILWAEASASTIKYYIRRLDDLTIAPTTGSLSTDIPAAGTGMFPHFIVNNNATAANTTLSVMSYHFQTGI